MLERLGQASEHYQCRLHAFCLIPNHFHLLAEVGELALEGVMKSLPLEEKIHLLRSYVWSSYRSYAGFEKKQSFVDYGPLSAVLRSGRKTTAESYRDFVESGLAKTDRELTRLLQRSSKAVGGDSFCRWAEEQHDRLTALQGIPEEVAMRRREVGMDPDLLLAEVCREYGIQIEELSRRGSCAESRWIAMKLLTEQVGMSQAAAAKKLGLRQGSRVSQCLKALDEQLKKRKKPDLALPNILGRLLKY